MEFKGTKVFPKYEGGDNYSIDLIFDNEAVISIDRRSRYTDKVVISREEMKANAKLIACAPEMLEMLTLIRNKYLTAHAPESVFDELESLIKKATE